MSNAVFLDSNYATYNPCLLLVRDKGYEIRIKCYKSPERSRCLYFAINDRVQLTGTSGPELLGLVVLWETYGETWNRQSPDIIDEVIVNEEETE
jgi:hypothetical protein